MNCASVTPQSVVVCRLCTKSHEYYVNIFISNESCEIMVEEAIQDLLGLPVTVGDGLPNFVCRLCVRKLIEFREFKNMCFKSATELRAYALGNDFLISNIKGEDAADVDTSGEGTSQENPFLNDMHVTEVYVTTPDELAVGNVSNAKEELWSTENALVVKEEVNDGEHRIEGFVQANALTSVAVDPLAVDTMSHAKEELWSTENALVVKEEDNGDEHHIEGDVPMNALTSVAVDPLAFHMMGETSGRGNVDHAGNSCEGTTVFIHPASPGLCDQGKVKKEMDDSDSEGEWESHSGRMNVEDGIEHTVGSSLSSDPLAAVSSVDRRYETCGIPERSLKTSESSSVPVLEDERDLKPVVSDTGDVNATWEDETGKFETVSAEESFRSDEHGQEFSHGSASFYHVGTHGDGTVFNCELCDIGFVTKTDLMNHLQLHTDLKQFKCDICDKEFGRRNELKAHAFTHAGLKIFKCDVCGEKYNQRSELKAHEVTHAVSKMFKCDVCEKEFSHVSSLRTHATTHFDLKPHKCEVCGKSFKRRDHLNMHRTIHTGLKPFRCEICGKCFKRSDTLNMHRAIHTGLKPFKCEVCGKCFNRKDKVKTHSRIHNKTKAYSCHVCGKGFHRKNDLLLHLSTHSDSKPFKCVVCDKSFAHGKYLKSHLDTHLDTHDILDLL